MNTRLQACLQLMRPPNLLTAVSDIWAGVALSGYLGGDHAVKAGPVVLLSLASIFLYAGGVVMNDVFDAGIDAAERPERPIPSGRISPSAAGRFGIILLIAGIFLAALTGWWSGLLAALIALACLLYDRRGKHHDLWGPLNMGACRGLNLWLGMSIVSTGLLSFNWVILLPVIYIAAVTLISRGEVHGGNRSSAITALVLYIVVILAVAAVACLRHSLPVTLIFLALFAVFIFPPLLKALSTLSGNLIGKAVKAGVLGLILLNASWVAAGAGWQWALATALLLPLSIAIARRFAVT